MSTGSDPGIEQYVIHQRRVQHVTNAIQDRCLRNFVRYGQQFLPDGTSPDWNESAIDEMTKLRQAWHDGDGSWADATLYLLIDAHRLDSLPELRWALVKLGARVTAWIADVDRRVDESRRIAQNVPVIPGDVS